jgi:hypothetical protein
MRRVVQGRRRSKVLSLCQATRLVGMGEGWVEVVILGREAIVLLYDYDDD